ncbi:hypothetical protein M3201_11690 [Paenibacillus motobuensis]|uniref:hypothetical protein n=1 Tax=Paenibacillus TaxID=44249 RepID=UPI00203BC48B|nr:MULTISPECIES: hypothetical protein [Paenibacillus]MCM3040362.1 hypothetical protein [Paenibacillus lutimineralis]MCM3647466.1 hypothetical protein [Paenibacillus motobuensis]
MRIRLSVMKLTVVFSLVLPVAACQIGETKTAGDWFDLTYAGLAGHEQLTFQGNAVLARGKQEKIEDSFAYVGELNDHHELNMRTVLPGGQGQKLQTTEVQTGQGLEAKLRWQGGAWMIASSNANAFTRGIARLNPLDQLEDIRRASKKNLSLEKGAARGTEVLRIELDPQEAKQQLKAKLDGEMEGIRADWSSKKKQVSSKYSSEVETEMNNLWVNGNKQLEQMIEQADAKVVYYLTVNRKTGLPARLVSETRLSYPNPLGITEHEVLYTDNQFSKIK